MKRRFLTALFLSGPVSLAFAADDSTLPKPDPAFNGTIGTRDDSKVDWPKRPHAHGGAPNVVLIHLDDVGFGATNVFGGPVEAPTLRSLTDNGLRYNRFEPLPAGKVTVAVEFTPDPGAPEQPAAPFSPALPVGGVITLSINGKAVGSGHILGIGNNTDTFDIGYDRGSPVSASYTSPFAFTGEVESVKVELK
jgi:hypothetical protein